MLKTETREIGGLQFTCTQFSAMRSMRLLALLARHVAPALGNLSGLKMTDDISKFAPAVALLLASLGPAELETVIMESLASTQVLLPGNAGPQLLTLSSREAIDIAFSGRLATMLGATKFALEVNFGGFLAASGLAGAAGPALPSTSLRT